MITAKTYNLKVVFEKQCWEKIIGWTKAAKCEVSGVGLVRKEKEYLVVYKVFLPKQRGSHTATKLSPEGTYDVQKWCLENKQPVENIRLWWHSHYDFNVFWSGTDEKQAREQLAHCEDYYLSVVVNQKKEYKCRIDIPSPLGICIDEIPVYLKGEAKKRSSSYYKKQVEKKVTIDKFMPDLEGLGTKVTEKKVWEFPGYSDYYRKFDNKSYGIDDIKRDLEKQNDVNKHEPSPKGKIWYDGEYMTWDEFREVRQAQLW